MPGIGAALYLILQVFSKRDANKIQEGLVAIVNPTKKINDLEKRLQFSDTYQNRVDLADAYLANKNYQKAIEQYLEALKDKAQNKYYVVNKLVEAYYYTQDYNEVIKHATSIKDEHDFKKSRAQFILGLAQDKLGDFEAAENNLRQINIRYSFYEERLVLAKFLITHNKIQDAKEILEDVVLESQNMTQTNKRLYRATVQEANKVLADIQ
ncbi:hypothetical protein AW14_00955 [Siansivirga zeaxanthinifaciens CC-SAMT-1]|uniref:Uncharacterized protein n=2 Tax=Siansivirga TaxID=1204360 RepID=A0A0C5WHS3_9FLAO|nr:hypothetical protein AW14_00955 [Siansivirga zeaxanthinifaciens CC-SAMT-1]